MFYKKMCKYTNRKDRRDKDWVPAEQEVEDKAERYPAMRKLWQEKNDRLIKMKNLTYDELLEGRAVIRGECDALQKKIDEEEEKNGGMSGISRIDILCILLASLCLIS